MGYYFIESGQKSLLVNVSGERCEGTVRDGLLILGGECFPDRTANACSLGLLQLFQDQQGNQLE